MNLILGGLFRMLQTAIGLSVGDTCVVIYDMLEILLEICPVASPISKFILWA